MYFKADKNGDIIFEIQDEEGRTVEIIEIDNLKPEEKLHIEMFAGEFNH